MDYPGDIKVKCKLPLRNLGLKCNYTVCTYIQYFIKGNIKDTLVVVGQVVDCWWCNCVHLPS